MKTLQINAVVLLFFCLFAPFLSAQKKENALEGTTFTIVLTEHNADSESSSVISDEITFVNNKVHSKTMSSYGMEASHYYFKPDTVQGKPGILFVGENIDTNGKTIFFVGRVCGTRIEGTVKWFAKSKTWKFSGNLKYAAAER